MGVYSHDVGLIMESKDGLDWMEPEISFQSSIFFQMTRRHNVQRVINGIDTALEAGLSIKINAVLMKGINDNQILPLLQYAFDRNLVVRFLEVMSMGHSN